MDHTKSYLDISKVLYRLGCIALSIYILKLTKFQIFVGGKKSVNKSLYFNGTAIASTHRTVYLVFTSELYTADASSAPSSSSMGGACSSFTTSSSPTIYSTSVTDSKAMQVESCSSAVGVSNRGVSEKQLTSNTVQQQQSTPKRHTVLYISPPPEDLLDNSRMSCQDEGCGLESEQSCSMWMEDSPSNFSNMSTSSYNDNTEVPRKSRKRNPKQRPGIKRRDCEESNMDIFDADSAKAPHYVLSQLSTDSKGNSKAGNGLVSVFCLFFFKKKFYHHM